MKPWLALAAALAALVASPAGAQAPTDSRADLIRYLDGLAASQLSARKTAVADIRTRDDVERRQAEVRAKALDLIGGLPERAGPLAARVTGGLEGVAREVPGGRELFGGEPTDQLALDLHIGGRVESDGLDLRARMLLQDLGLEGESAILEVRQRLRLTPSTLTSLADRLERDGYLERRRHPTDRRTVVLALTAVVFTASAAYSLRERQRPRSYAALFLALQTTSLGSSWGEA